MRLLFDNYHSQSLGGLQLQKELVRTIIERAPSDCEILLTRNKIGNTTLSNGIKTIYNTNNINNGYTGYLKWYHHELPKVAKENDINVIYSFSGLLSNRVVKNFGTISTVNNMLPFDRKVISSYPIYSKDRWRYNLLRKLYIKSLQIADNVILHSQGALNMIEKYTGSISLKTTVVLTGVPRDCSIEQSIQLLNPYGNKPYIFYMSAVEPYKNHFRLVNAYSRALKSDDTIPNLILAGVPSCKREIKRLNGIIKKLNLEKKVFYLGKILKENIPAWLKNAEFNIYPSLCETNSLIISEILGMGGVLVCSNIDTIVEVTGNACEVFNPYSIDSIANAILKINRDPKRREKLRRFALQRSKNNSWSKCGNTVWQLAEKAHNAYKKRI